MKIGVLATISLVLGLSMAAWAGLGVDTDGDGVLDSADNCITVANASPADCDDDSDGFGNACDGDHDQSGTVNAADFTLIFVPAFQTTIPTPAGEDMDCSGTVNATDFTQLFVPQFQSTVPGPSCCAP